MDLEIRLNDIYRSLIDHYGGQGWWPADSKLECAVGAILTQNTSWKNVEIAIRNIKSVMDITEVNLTSISLEELSILIKPSGFYNQKARRIKSLTDFINSSYGGKIENMQTDNPFTLRQKLLQINGIGPETADCILLYALGKKFFVVDKYTYRLLYRHGIIDNQADYNEIQKIFMDNIEMNTELYSEFHALIVKLGKNNCGRKSNCRGCPLEHDPHVLSDVVI